jgi:hypothetical protein
MNGFYCWNWRMLHSVIQLLSFQTQLGRIYNLVSFVWIMLRDKGLHNSFHNITLS